MLQTLLTILYIPVSIFLILVVLLQTGKRADLAGAFGGGGSQTAFGARGAATLLTKLTTIAAVLFMLCALALAILASRGPGGGGSVLDQVPVSTPLTDPAALPPADGTDATGALPTDDGTLLEESTPEPVDGAGDAPEPAVDLTGDAPADDSQP